MERESARDHEPYRERESAGGRGHWVFMRSFTKLVFSTFPPHFNFSALFYSNYFHPHVRVCGDVCECVCKSFCLFGFVWIHTSLQLWLLQHRQSENMPTNFSSFTLTIQYSGEITENWSTYHATFLLGVKVKTERTKS